MRVDVGFAEEGIVLLVVDPEGQPLSARIEHRSKRGFGGTTTSRRGRVELGHNYVPGEAVTLYVQDENQRHAPKRLTLEAPRGEVEIVAPGSLPTDGIVVEDARTFD